MITSSLPTVEENTSLITIIDKISRGEQGLAVVIEKDRVIKGIVTDGDIRRAMEKYGQEVFAMTASDLMCSSPKTISPNELVSYADEIMQDAKLNKLLVEQAGKLIGILRK